MSSTPFSAMAMLTRLGLSLFWLSTWGMLVVRAEPLPAPSAPTGGELLQNLTLLHVHPLAGHDQLGDGSIYRPYKTMTTAIQIAQPNTVILLAAGTYSQQTGERFPIRLKPGITVQGDPETQGRNTRIQGGGAFQSATAGSQWVAMVGASQTTVVGVTITNPQGYGLWVENSHPVVMQTTLSGNGRDGMAILGTSAPTVQNNYVTANQASGIGIYGMAQPKVHRNLIQATGVGIHVSDQAAPILTDNRLLQNTFGILSQGQSRPILRNNLLEGNTQDGLIVVAQSQPDLGSVSDPGRNIFRANQRWDLNAQSADQPVTGVGNEILPSRMVGVVRLESAPPVGGPATASPQPPAEISAESFPVPRALSQPPAASVVPPTAQPLPPAVVVPPSRPVEPPPVPQSRQPMQRPPTTARPDRVLITSPPPVVFSRESEPATPAPPTRVLIHTLPPIPAQLGSPPRPPASRTVSTAIPAPAQPAVISGVLPVPKSEIPIGDAGDQALPFSAIGADTAPGTPPPPPLTVAATRPPITSGYRLLVPVTSEAQQQVVKSLVPDAFRTQHQGQAMMQVGVFSERYRAEQVQNELARRGFRVMLESLQ